MKAESEMIQRFDRSHGTTVEMAHPQKKAPLMTVTTVERPGTAGLWQGMMQRTWDKGEGIKKGDFALSS